MEKQKQKQQEPPVKPKKKTSNVTSQAQALALAQPTSSELPAGSALSAVRGKNIAVESFTGEIQEQEEEEEEEEGENVIDDPTDKIDERDPEELKAKKLASKLQQLKITAYLSALAEHKKVEDNKKINAEVGLFFITCILYELCLQCHMLCTFSYSYSYSYSCSYSYINSTERRKEQLF